MTNTAAQLLTVLGQHWVLVPIGCLELVVATVLAAAILCGKREEKGHGYRLKGAERAFLSSWTGRTDEACLVFRNRDRLPVYAAGDTGKLLGVTLPEIQEDFAALSRHMADPEELEAGWKEYLSWDGKGIFGRSWEQPGGEWIRLSVWRDPSGEYDLLTFRRDTEYHRQLEESRKHLEEAHEARRSKTSFLSRMPREIRTPMNCIQGLLTRAEGKLENGSEAYQYLEKAQELSDHQLALINDILDMSRIEAGKVELEEKPFGLRALGNRLYDMFAKNLEARGIRYEVNFEEMTVDRVIGDELRISQVIINFLSNAVKFTSEGEIIVTFRQMMLRDHTADLMIRVHDTGIGMKPEFINRIFRPFEQESIETSKKYGGTGLGMAITDQLVRLMGGEIVVESMPGKGSDFSVFLHLPVAEEEGAFTEEKTEAPAEQGNGDPKAVFHGKRILYAEDNEINAMIARELLEGMGAEVEIAANGREAVERFETHSAGYYDFILMDVQMPEMDGRTAARTIRGLKRSDAEQIPIFALSADAFVEDERLSRESGMDGHFAKPVDYDVVGQGISDFLRRRGKQQ